MKVLSRLVSLGCAAVMILALTGTSWADSPTAQTICPGGDPIASGLWRGVGIATGTSYVCSPGGGSNYRPGVGQPTAGTWPQRTSPQTQMQLQGQNQPQNQPRAQASPQTSGVGNTANVVGGVSYVALGDSVAAGQGLPLQNGADQTCGVSYQAYPAYVASALGWPYRNVACSGATIGDLTTKQHRSNTSPDMPPQLDAAFANGTPTLMTLTAGANDIYWQQFVRKCYGGSCGSATEQTAITQLIKAMQLKLSYALQSIATRSQGRPPIVIVTGYYQPFSANCAGQSKITSQGITWINSQVDAVNQALANTTGSFSFARFASVSFTGHELCSSSPWIQGEYESAPAHPTAQGQQAIAQSVLTAMYGQSNRNGYGY